MESVTLTSADGASATHPLFVGAPGQPVVLVWPAMGVPARFYAALARRLTQAGMQVLLCELRGTGSSSVKPARSRTFGMRELLELDFPTAVAFARERFPKSPMVFWGHSLGGQLACLHQARTQGSARAEALILTASCSVYFGAYPFPSNLAVLAGTQAAHAIARALGHYPGHRLGFGGHQARGIIRDWAYQSRTGRYAPSGMSEDLEAGMRHVATPTLAVSIAGDDWAPPSAVDHLVTKLAAGSSERWHLTAADLGVEKVDHFSWAKHPDVLVSRAATWLSGKLQAPSAPRPATT